MSSNTNQAERGVREYKSFSNEVWNEETRKDIEFKVGDRIDRWATGFGRASGTIVAIDYTSHRDPYRVIRDGAPDAMAIYIECRGATKLAPMPKYLKFDTFPKVPQGECLVHSMSPDIGFGITLHDIACQQCFNNPAVNGCEPCWECRKAGHRYIKIDPKTVVVNVPK